MRKFLSIFLAIMMIMTTGTVVACAVDDDLVGIYGGIDMVRYGDSVYYPGTMRLSRDYTDICYDVSGLKDGRTVIEVSTSYKQKYLQFEDVLPSKELHDIGGTIENISAKQSESDERYTYITFDIVFDGFSSLPRNMILFNVKYTVLIDYFVTSGGIVNLYSPFTRHDWYLIGSENVEYHFSDKGIIDFNVFFTDGYEYEFLLYKYRDYIPYDPGNVITATGLQLDKNELQMKCGRLYNFKPMVETADNDTYSIIWSSSDTSVATVDIYGKVKAQGNGTAVITARIGGTDISDTCTVKVTTNPWQVMMHIFSVIFSWIYRIYG